MMKWDVESGLAYIDDTTESLSKSGRDDFVVQNSAGLADEARQGARIVRRRMIAICIILSIAFALILVVLFDHFSTR